MSDHDGKDRTLAVIVNGVSATIEAKDNKPLRSIIKDGLEATDQQAGHPLSDWEVRLDGQPLDLDKKIGDYNFPATVVLHIDLRAGGGG